ncbi:hypothetical protein KI387_004644, partial [Taxus chinensis]
ISIFPADALIEVAAMGFFYLEDWLEFWNPSSQAKESDGQLQWVNDGFVDIRRRPVLKTKSGGWRASLFIIGVEVSERLTYYGIASNLIIYLTSVMHEGVAASVKNVNYWVGVTTIMPLLGGFVADAYSGRYWAVLVSSTVYLMGLILLTLSVSLSALRPGECVEACSKEPAGKRAVFFLALYLIAVGTGGHKPSLQAFGADQFNEEDKDEKLKKASFFNWWYFGLCCGTLMAVTVVVYVQNNISWGVGFGIPTIAMAIAIVLFLYGTPFYRNKLPGGSPITSILQVIAAAVRNRKENLPSNMGLLYENWDAGSLKSGQRRLTHTDSFQFLDKAAIMMNLSEPNWTQGNKQPNPGMVCTVTQVEETKLILRMVPIWFCCIIFGITVAQSTTFFIKQGNTMDRNMGPHFQIPPASLLAFSSISILIFISIYDTLLVPMAQKITGHHRGISILQRIGIGMVFSILCMVSAALIEIKRIHTAKSHGLLDRPKTTIPLSIFWLTPQFVLIGIADVFTLVGLQEFFYDQVPDTMRSLGISFFLSVIGVASFISSLLITIVDKITSRGGGDHGWFTNNLNRCKLSYFYWLLTVLGVINLCGYLYVANTYSYKRIREVEDGILGPT